MNFDKSTIELDDLFMLYILMKFQDDDLRLITIASIKGLNFKFLYLKLCMKDGLLSWILNSIWLVWNLVYVLKT